MKVRIKTESQFLEKFGSNWRKQVYKEFPQEMDKYLGKEMILCIEQQEKYKRYKYFWFDNFMFSEDMIVSLSEKINKLLKI